MVSRIVVEDCAAIAKSILPMARKLDGKTVLVTGAVGMLGSYMVDTLAALNDAGVAVNIVALDNMAGGIPNRLDHLKGKPFFTFLSHDVRKPLPAGVNADYIIHAAGIASPITYRKYPIDTMDVNVVGTRHLLEYSREHGVKSLLYFSSSEIYGDPDAANIPTAEDYRGFVSCTGPRACYDESKRYGETLCVYFNQQYGVPSKIVRPFNVYGPGMRKDDGRVVPDLIANAVDGKPLVLLSTGTDTRSFCYIADAIDGFLRVFLSDHSGEPFNVGNDMQEISMAEFAKAVSEVSGGLPVEFKKSAEADYLADNPKRRAPNLAKVRKLGYEPKIVLKAGLARMLEWAKTEWK
jgi:dTDP-glucose 4,6-dehydratase/UDP-glucuronate decarboxylase